MIRSTASTAILLGGLWLGLAEPARADQVTFDLGTPTVTATSASFDVGLTFTGSAGDTIEAIQLSVLGSDPLLTLNGTDFSRFSFATDAATLPGWTELVPLASGGVGLYAPSDPAAGPFLAPSATPYHIGVLSVDLSGIPGDTSLVVTLAGGPAGLGTDVGGTVGGTDVPSFASAGLVAFAQPNGVSFRTLVPEPGGAALLALGGIIVLVGRRRRLSADQGAMRTVR